jgi:ABC-2 type transport system permease protein
MAASYIAVGMFWSSLTSDQIVAMLLSLVTLAILFALGWPVFLVWLSMVGMPEWCIGLLAAISPFKYFLSIARGVLDTRDLVYYALFCVFFLNANALVLKVRRATG